MAMDCEAQILYVFGGRVLDGDWDTSKYSGLYSYNVRLSRWRSLQSVNCLIDGGFFTQPISVYRQPDAPSTQGHPVIPPRFGESSLDISHCPPPLNAILQGIQWSLTLLPKSCIFLPVNERKDTYPTCMRMI